MARLIFIFKTDWNHYEQNKNKFESLQMNLDIEVTVTPNIIEDVGAIIHQSQRVAYTAVGHCLIT